LIINILIKWKKKWRLF